MVAYIVKDALSKGIRKVEAELAMDLRGIYVIGENGLSHYYGKRHWAPSYEEAIAKAETMRTKEIARLKRQIERLEKLKF
jgi:hypothetical protein